MADRWYAHEDFLGTWMVTTREDDEFESSIATGMQKEDAAEIVKLHNAIVDGFELVVLSDTGLGGRIEKGVYYIKKRMKI